MKTFVIGIDGNCGSGKSTLARILKEAFECNVYHMDDFYLPFSKREADWEKIPSGNMDIGRFCSEVLKPAKNGHGVRYRAFFCREDSYKEEIVYEPCKIHVVEGSYSHHPYLAPYYDLKIFLTCSKEEQERRLKAREGERFTFYQRRWIPMEERYYQAFGIRENADVVVETTGYQVYDQIVRQVIEIMK